MSGGQLFTFTSFASYLRDINIILMEEDRRVYIFILLKYECTSMTIEIPNTILMLHIEG